MSAKTESEAHNSDKHLLLGISSEVLPNDVILEITHKRDFNASDETSQFNYSYLIYEFKNPQKNIVRGKSYLDEPLRASLFFEKSDVDLEKVNSTESGKLLKSAYLTLCALGYYSINVLGEEGYEALTMPQLNITKIDVIRWASQMDKLGNNNAD